MFVLSLSARDWGEGEEQLAAALSRKSSNENGRWENMVNCTCLFNGECVCCLLLLHVVMWERG